MSEPAAIEEEKQLSDTNNNENESSPGSAQGHDSQICRDYQRGVCNRGGKCKFSHPDGLGKEIESGPMICRDFQNGKCSRSTCKYMHISNTEEKVYLRTGQLPMRRPPAPVRGPGYGYPTRANRGDPICKDFLNNKCTRGSSCKFRHSFEEDKGGYGPPGGYGGYDDYPRKRRRDSYGDADYGHLKEENESLRRQLGDLQKQVSDLKATNEVLLEQNARYRNQASSSTAYPSTPSYGTTSYAAKNPTPAVAAPTNYASSYLTAYNGNTAATYTTASSYTTDNPSYTTTSNYGVTSSDSTTYSSSYPSGTGYIKFE